MTAQARDGDAVQARKTSKQGWGPQDGDRGHSEVQGWHPGQEGKLGNARKRQPTEEAEVLGVEVRGPEGRPKGCVQQQVATSDRQQQEVRAEVGTRLCPTHSQRSGGAPVQ